MNIRTAATISAILFATPIVALGFTELEEVDLAVKYPCVRVAWENMETLAHGSGSPMKHEDAFRRLYHLRSTNGSSGVYYFIVPSQCDDDSVGKSLPGQSSQSPAASEPSLSVPSSPDMEDFGWGW